MKKTIIIGKNIYPDIDLDTQKKINSFEKRFGIKIDFLFDEGVQLTYQTDSYDIATCPGDLSFIDSRTKIILITFIESFDELQFFSKTDELLLSIPILEEL